MSVIITEACEVIEPTQEDGRTVNKRIKLKAGQEYSGCKAGDLVDARKAKHIEPDEKPAKKVKKRSKKVVAPKNTKKKTTAKKKAPAKKKK
jgi:hypothetical protein